MNKDYEIYFRPNSKNKCSGAGDVLFIEHIPKYPNLIHCLASVDMWKRVGCNYILSTPNIFSCPNLPPNLPKSTKQ